MIKWLEEFKEDVDRRGAYLEVEDDNLVIVSHKTVTRLIAIAELLEKVVGDGTGGLEGKRVVWPLRAAYGREARKLLTDNETTT